MFFWGFSFVVAGCKEGLGKKKVGQLGFKETKRCGVLFFVHVMMEPELGRCLPKDKIQISSLFLAKTEREKAKMLFLVERIRYCMNT